MNHVMVDIETLGVGRDAAIASVGACRFDPSTGAIGATFHAKVDFSAEMGNIDAQTVRWWLEQSNEVRAALLSGERVPLPEALASFSRFLGEGPVEGLWSNGPTFDERILREAFDRLGMRFPVSFRASRDCRTVFAIGKGWRLPKVEREGPAHDALADAVYQARCVSAILNLIEERIQ